MECQKNRDLNASINILNRALNSTSSNFDSKTVKATAGHAERYASGDFTSVPQQEDISRINESGTIFGDSR